MRELKQQGQPSDIASRRELEEMLEVRERKRLLRAEGHLAQQQLVRGQVEIGHRRLDLIWRFLLLGMTLVSFAFALAGSLSLPVAMLVASGLGGTGIAARRGGGG
jgi:hypothetical protein